MPEEKSATLWVMSNRLDDRVVLFERDPAHPSGEAFVAGSTPAFVGRTGDVERLLREGQMIEVPEPADGRKKPIPVGDEALGEANALPGRVTPLGRKLDPDLYPKGTTKAVEEQQERAGDELAVPAGTVVPPEPPAERETRRR